jgi:multiple sugar transport system ATP-binding protein
VFLMDEPLSNLDAKLRVQLRVELKRLHQQLGITTIYVTHDQEEALTLGDSVAVMNDGRVDQRGTPEVIYHDPATLFVAKFVGSPEINTFTAVIENGGADGLRLRAPSIEVPLERSGDGAPPNGDVTVAVRPESVRIGSPEQYPIPGVVDVVEMVGRELRVYLDTEAGSIVGIIPASERRHRPGERVSLTFSNDGHHLFDPQGQVIRSIRPTTEEALHA